MYRLENMMKAFDVYSKEKLFLLDKYMEKILEKNEMINLTRITDQNEFIAKHYMDSIVIQDEYEFASSKTIIDVGTGGGFPGVPLAILNPDKHFVLLDSLQKRLKVIKGICDELGIDNIEVVHGRAEELARKKQYREKFDLCVSRAVANTAVLAELCLPFVAVGGSFIAYKGPNLEDELKVGERAIEVLGGEIDRVISTSGTENDHKLLFVTKVNSTSKLYPRKPGEPGRNPIK